MQDILQQFRRELHGCWRYRWQAIITAWAICIAGWLFVLSMPDIYQASARVYVDADSRLAEVVGQVGVAPGVGSRVFVVRQAMLGQPQLERVARETDLDLRARTEDERVKLIVSLSEKVSVTTGRTSQAQNLYTISFEDYDRRMAIAVVQTLLDTFVEDVLKLKEKGVEDVTGYLRDQLTYYSGLLSESEGRLADFKKKYVGLLPGENGGVFERMQAEMDLLKQLQLDLQVELDRRDELRRQLATDDPMLPEGADGSMGIAVTGNATDLAITGLQTRRAELLLSVTARHPDVVAIDEQLEQLHEKRRLEQEALRSGGRGIEGAANATNPVYQTAQIALNEASVTIAALRSQITQREAMVRSLNEQITTIPEIEAEYAQLTRNYDQYRSLYNELLLQKERERLGSVGDERDVVSFNIVEPPTATIEPVAPKRGLLLVVTLLVGLGAGAGVAFLMHQLNPVFCDAETLRQVSMRPVLGVVSKTWLDRRKARRRTDLLTFASATTGLVLLFAGTLIFQDVGVVVLHEFLTRSKG